MQVGRPQKINKNIIVKLEEAFLLGCTDREACLYAGIGMSTLYDYQNSFPEFRERKIILKSDPFLKARKTIIGALDSNVDLAFKYIKLKLQAEILQELQQQEPEISEHEQNMSIEELEERTKHALIAIQEAAKYGK